MAYIYHEQNLPTKYDHLRIHKYNLHFTHVLLKLFMSFFIYYFCSLKEMQIKKEIGYPQCFSLDEPQQGK